MVMLSHQGSNSLGEQSGIVCHQALAFVGVWASLGLSWDLGEELKLLGFCLAAWLRGVGWVMMKILTQTKSRMQLAA